MARKNNIFLPLVWGHNNHIQTCFPAIFSPKTNIAIRWEQVNLPDGDFLDGCWAGGDSGPIVVMLTGVEGSLHSHYIQSSLDEFVAQGFRVFVMHHRGCSGRPNRLRRGYHCGDISDLSFVVRQLSIRYPAVPLLLLGFSLGGSLALRYLADKNYPKELVAVTAVSVPYDLAATVDYMHPIYSLRLVKSLNDKLMQKVKMGHRFGVSSTALKAIRSLRAFDELITSSLYGYDSADAYYQQCSVADRLNDVGKPVLLLHAADDPFVPRDCIPSSSKLSSKVRLEVSGQGGHVGFIGGKPWKPIYWLPYRVIEFFRSEILVSHNLVVND